MKPKTVAICDDCWRKERGVQAPEPVRLKQPVEEECGICLAHTRSGIYVRGMVDDAAAAD